MTHTRISILTAVLAAGLIGADQGPAPQYDAKGQLLFPADYREWVFLSSGLGMSYSPPAPGREEHQQFDNVFAAPPAYRSFLKTGRWPDKTVLLIEVRAASSKGSINQAGYFQTDLTEIEAEVKDEKRFPTQWAFFSFGKGLAAGRQRPTSDACYSCHAEHGAVDHTFVQFYPTLLKVAREKGTLEAGYAERPVR